MDFENNEPCEIPDFFDFWDDIWLFAINAMHFRPDFDEEALNRANAEVNRMLSGWCNCHPEYLPY